MGLVRHFSELRVYRQAFKAAMTIYRLSRKWPPDERYSLTSQATRASRSVCSNIAEGWRKRRYPNHFVSKLTDADGEAAETQTWLQFAHACGYLSEEVYKDLWAACDQVSAGLVNTMTHPDDWCGPAQMVREEPVEYTVSGEDEAA